MIRILHIACLAGVLLVATLLPAAAQNPKTFGETYLEISTYTPGVDPDIDMFMHNWRESMPRHTHGSLIERDILSAGNPDNPSTRGAVLRHANRFVHASLYPATRTAETTLAGEQEIFYVLSGQGIMEGGGVTADLYPGVSVLVPPQIAFTITNHADKALNMYLLSEPVPPGFTPNREITVRDEHAIDYDYTDMHWSMKVKTLFDWPDGLATVDNVLLVEFPPMTIGHPHVYVAGSEEVWTAVEGETIAFLGKQIRRQTPGTAYLVPPDGKIVHANINESAETVKFFYYLKSADPDFRKR